MPLGVAFAALLTVTAVCRAQHAAPVGWLTWGYDQERSGWNRGETALSAANVSRLELRWKTRLSTVPNETVLSTLTAPLVVHDVMTTQGLKTVVFLIGSDNVVFALDGTSGRILWQKGFAGSLSPKGPATWLCPNTPNSTPVIDREAATMYFVSVDGRLHAPTFSNRATTLSCHRIYYTLRQELESKSDRSRNLYERGAGLRRGRIQCRRDGLDLSPPRDGDAFLHQHGKCLQERGGAAGS